jgi:[ribosomal protein S5]-alanine N-acetyltransferase
MFGLFKHQGPVLRGQLTMLRAPEPSDFEAWSVLRAHSQNELRPFEPKWSDHELTRSAYAARVRMAKRLSDSGDGFNFLIFDATNHTLVGGITLGNIKRGASQAAEIGYWLGTPHLRRGYMTDAINAILRFAFQNQRLQRIEAACIQSNERSEAVLLRCGFQYEGLARHYLEINGRRQDHKLFARLVSDV